MVGPLSRFAPNPTPCGRSRREFLWQVGGGFAGLALLDLLSRDGLLDRPARGGESAASPLAPKPPHFPAKAKHVVFLFMNGAPSQVDTFDYKPALDRYDGTPYRGDTPVGSNGRPIGHLMKSPFPFAPHGESGLPISSLFPHTARFADDLLRHLQETCSVRDPLSAAAASVEPGDRQSAGRSGAPRTRALPGPTAERHGAVRSSPT